LAEQEHRQAEKHADAMARSRAAALATIAELEAAESELLDRLAVESR
jgi:hypothetical protein